MTNLQKFAKYIALVVRRVLFGYPGRVSEVEAIMVPLNKYMILYSIFEGGLTSAQETIMQNIFDSILAPD